MFHRATYLTLVLLTVSCQRSLFASSPSTRLRRKRFSTPSFLSVPTKDNISLPQADNSTTTTLQNVYTGTNVVDGNLLYNQEPHRISYLPPPELRRSLTSSQSFDWTQVGNDLDGEAADDKSGYSVGMSADGRRVIVGAPSCSNCGGARYNDDGNGFRAGYARIYEENNGTWTQVGNDLDGEAADDESGRSVGMSADGKRVIVGAPGNDGNPFIAGHARIYEENNGTWTQVGNDLDGEAAYDESGSSVGMSADGIRVIVGALYNGRAGHARIYEENNGTWTQVGNDLDGEASSDQSGYSVGMSADGKRVIVGAPYNDGNGFRAGHARIYEENNGTWTQVGNDLDGEALCDQSGSSVGMSADGKRVIVGAPYNSYNYGNGYRAGHARIYEEKGGSWTQVGNDLDGEAAYDESGSSVGMSADGKRVIVGDPYNDGNGFRAGHARIYEEINGTWTQVGKDLDGEGTGDYSGSSVGMSADGRRVIVGAPSCSTCGSGTDAGRVRIYEAYPSESSADFPFKFLFVIGPVVGVIFIFLFYTLWKNKQVNCKSCNIGSSPILTF